MVSNRNLIFQRVIFRCDLSGSGRLHSIVAHLNFVIPPSLYQLLMEVHHTISSSFLKYMFCG